MTIFLEQGSINNQPNLNDIIAHYEKTLQVMDTDAWLIKGGIINEKKELLADNETCRKVENLKNIVQAIIT